MKLIYITVTMPFGNAEQFLIPEAFELVRQGQILIIPRSPLGDLVNTDAKGLRNVTVVQPLFSVEIISTAVCEFVRNPVKSLRALGILLLSRNLKILLKNLAVFPKSLWLSRIARKWGATHIHAHWATTTATMALIANQVSGISWSFTVHRGDIYEDNLLAEKVESASFVRCISYDGKRAVLGLIGEFFEPKITVLHMGVTIDPYRQFAPNKVNEGFVIGVPANLLPVKGHKYLIDACSILKEMMHHPFRCYLYGEGPLKQKLANYIDKKGLNDIVKIEGQLPRNKLMELYQTGQIDVVVIPSINTEDGQHEGIPVSLMEAMAYGIPVVSTNTGAIPELIGDGSGVMIKEKNAGALAEAIDRLIKDAEYYTVIAKRGKSEVLTHFNSASIAEALLRLFKAHAMRS
jgi:colanic acid/amylovoran biosynthesis glycosyltransferase